MKEKIRLYYKKINHYIVPIRGREDLGALQNIIVITGWCIVLCVLSSIILRCMHLKYTIMYDYAVGIACSAVVVLFTTIIQYSREHSKKLKEFNIIIFPILTSMCLLEDENDVLLKKRLDVFLSYFDSYNKYISKLFWFDAEKDSVYIKLIIEMTKVMILVYLGQRSYNKRTTFRKFTDSVLITSGQEHCPRGTS